MIVVLSGAGVPIRLTDERWRHLTSRHPELKGQLERVAETVTEPDIIQVGDSGELLAVRFYEQTPLTRTFLVVAYRETDPGDGFALTAYFARRPSRQRVTAWKR